MCRQAARTSLYENPEYLKVPFAQDDAGFDQLSADPNNPTVKPVPYVGIQYRRHSGVCRASPRRSARNSRPCYAGQQSVEEALEKAQTIFTAEEMEAAGY